MHDRARVRARVLVCACGYVCKLVLSTQARAYIHTRAGGKRALTASRLVPRSLYLFDNAIPGLALGVFDGLTSLT